MKTLTWKYIYVPTMKKKRKKKELWFFIWWFKHNLLKHQSRWQPCVTTALPVSHEVLSPGRQLPTSWYKIAPLLIPHNPTLVFTESTFKRWGKLKKHMVVDVLRLQSWSYLQLNTLWFMSSSKVSMSLKYTVTLWPVYLIQQGKGRWGKGSGTCEEVLLTEARAQDGKT